jgi:hypothetical protein
VTGGPILILDKCALQALSLAEVKALPRCFTINVPPILTLEVQGDLNKKKGLGKHGDSQMEVQMLADKLIGLFDHDNNVHYRPMLQAELVGHSVEMRGVPVIQQGFKKVPTGDGTHGILIEEHPDRPRYRRWSELQFTPEERQQAAQWREWSRKLNIEGLLPLLRKRAESLGKPTTLAEALQIVDKLLSATPQDQFVEVLLRLCSFSRQIEEATANRWKRTQFKTLDYFAPYGKFVLRIILLYSLGLANGLITPKPTNVVDLEYLFYLPFCMVFSSGDKFVIQMAKALMTQKQQFISRDELKADMKAVADYYEADVEQRAIFAESYKSQLNGVFTHPLWSTMNQIPWERPKRTLAGPESAVAYQKATQIMEALNKFKADQEESR